jgi:transposase
VSCSRDRVRGAHALEATRRGASRFAYASQGALTATQSEEPVVPASEYRSLLGQVRDLQRLLGKKTMEAEILKEALEFSAGSKKHLLRSLWWPKDGSR